MGGSGGSFLGGDPKGVASRLREAEQEADAQEFLTTVEHLLAEVLADANDRDTEAVQRHVETIQQALEKDIVGVVELLFGGSVSKRTYVEGMSDVDALAVVNESELAATDPNSVAEYLLKRLEERFPGRITPDGFAATVQFADATIQVIPVIRRGDDYLLPNSDCTAWSRARPKTFASALTDVNKECNGKLIPTVKLVKVILSQLPDKLRPSGYHVENLAVEAFRGYEGPYTPRAMLRHFFECAPERVRTPMPDPTGQSSAADEYLGSKDSVERLMVADAVARVGRRLRNADGAQNLEQWKRLLGVED